MGYDWTLTYWVVAFVAIQMGVAWIMRDADFLNLILAAYCIGGTCSHVLTLAIHELVHNLAFGCNSLTANRLLSYLANFPMIFPAAASTKKFHLVHHKKQGVDFDLPTKWEANLFRGPIGKTIWLMSLPWFYGLRPPLVTPLPMNKHEIFNIIIQTIFNIGVVYFMGWKALFYFFMSAITGYGIHPISGHLISEHYMWIKGQETYSYYGPLNFLTLNIGYHNEHHDFPNVPGRLLPEVTKLAPEFYQELPCHYSWVQVLFNFITDPEITLWSRIIEHTKLYREQHPNRFKAD